MVHRAMLTKEHVDAVDAPINGEIWIADTIQKGLGLRVWRSGAGTLGKAYCVRLSTIDGGQIRKTLNFWRAATRHPQWNSRIDNGFFYDNPPTHGDLIEIARAWAKDQIDKNLGRRTVAELEAEFLSRKMELFKRTTFAQGAEVLLREMSYNELSSAHMDRLRKLFFRFVQPRLKEACLLKIDVDDIQSILQQKTITNANRRVLQPFLGKILDLPHRNGIHSEINSYHIRYSRFQKSHQYSDDADSAARFDRYDELFLWLESEEARWQQALALRLYFYFHAPLSSILSARWSDLYDCKNERRTDYGFAPSWREWRYGPKWSQIQGVSTRINNLLIRCAKLGDSSDYWFPSPSQYRKEHIQSISGIWNLAQERFDLDRLTPRKLHKSYKQSLHWARAKREPIYEP